MLRHIIKCISISSEATDLEQMGHLKPERQENRMAFMVFKPEIAIIDVDILKQQQLCGAASAWTRTILTDPRPISSFMKSSRLCLFVTGYDLVFTRALL